MESVIGLARSTDFIGRAANARIAFDRHVTFASAQQSCRSMWICTGKSKPARLPIRLISRLTASDVCGTSGLLTTNLECVADCRIRL